VFLDDFRRSSFEFILLGTDFSQQFHLTANSTRASSHQTRVRQKIEAHS
jgi:hypothetical protein